MTKLVVASMPQFLERNFQRPPLIWSKRSMPALGLCSLHKLVISPWEICQPCSRRVLAHPRFEVIMRIKLIVGAVLLLASSHSFAQVSPPGSARSIPLKLGLGFSDFNTDWAG